MDVTGSYVLQEQGDEAGAAGRLQGSYYRCKELPFPHALEGNSNTQLYVTDAG
jgi:hypothetical protein